MNIERINFIFHCLYSAGTGFRPRKAAFLEGGMFDLKRGGTTNGIDFRNQ
jgi:hypothetical protein